MLLDVPGRRVQEGMHVAVENDRIKEVSSLPIRLEAARRIDLRGKTLMPGLIDLHVHVMATQVDIGRQRLLPDTMVVLRSVQILKKMLHRGFTTVRDAGGANATLRSAIEDGVIEGPRLFIAGKSLSQTAGNGDTRLSADTAAFGDERVLPLGALSRVCDGVDAVLRATREEFKAGADHIKVMASGGVTSPTDRIGTLGFSTAELTAIATEAAGRDSYVMAHAYSSAAIRHAVSCGIRTIEHGNLVDDETAALMARQGVFAVPTLATFEMNCRHAERLGLSRNAVSKLEEVREAGYRSLEIFRRHDVRIGYGTDLMGELHEFQNEEFRLRAEVLSPWEIIESATEVAADVLGMTGQLGVIAPGAIADAIVVNGLPCDDIDLLSRPETGIASVMKNGTLVRHSP